MRSTTKGALLVTAGLAAALGLPSPSAQARTTCERVGCDITITIHLTAVGGDQATIDAWIQDIENVWNGDTTAGSPGTFGECECPVTVDVQFAGFLPDCSSAAMQGYHCIEITPGPARDTAGRNYPAYMRGVSQNGSSITGWWSSQLMNQDVWIGPGEGQQGPPYYGGQAHDAAHEAGHMMGLGESTGVDIMGQPWAMGAHPTPEQITDIVANNCEGEDEECPDECCCGNGEVEGSKGEECDPEADPNGCPPLETCLLDCTCVYTGFCGDGEIATDYDEECDPAADPDGCMLTEICTDECVCIAPMVAVSIDEPPDGAIISATTPVVATVVSDLPVDRVEFFMDGLQTHTTASDPYTWLLDPLLFVPGPHDLHVFAYDTVGTEGSDAIVVFTELPSP